MNHSSTYVLLLLPLHIFSIKHLRTSKLISNFVTQRSQKIKKRKLENKIFQVKSKKLILVRDKKREKNVYLQVKNIPYKNDPKISCKIGIIVHLIILICCTQSTAYFETFHWLITLLTICQLGKVKSRIFWE